MIDDPYCDHHWTRDDMTTKQCIRCGKYAPVEDSDE